MKKNTRLITMLLLLVIAILLLLSLLPGLESFRRMALTLFIPYSALSGKDAKSPSVAYSYMTLALLTAIVLVFTSALQ